MACSKYFINPTDFVNLPRETKHDEAAETESIFHNTISVMNAFMPKNKIQASIYEILILTFADENPGRIAQISKINDDEIENAIENVKGSIATITVNNLSFTVEIKINTFLSSDQPSIYIK